MITTDISGTCDARFSAVRQALQDNFAERFEVGCCVSVVVEGRPVVDLWAGLRQLSMALPWQADTVVNMMSVTKSMGAVCLLLLADRGQLDLDATYASYWPAFGSHGKDRITVRHAMAQLAGIP